MMKNIEVLDCTLRDGGYYNNWDFDAKLIQEYINQIKSTKIRYIEIGFRSIEENKNKGLTAYSTDHLLKKLKVSENILVGVMLNASELFSTNKSPLKNCKKIFRNIKYSKIRFVRLACHLHEIFLLKKIIDWLKKQGLIVFINLMQISEINNKKIKETCFFLKDTKTDILYLADSLGSLNPSTTKTLVKKFKKYWKLDLGFHAHNNLDLAKKNAITANNFGVKWIDSTIMGMGRGPGNLLTEDIINYLYTIPKKNIFNYKIRNYFLKLKKKYKWGPNKYYAIAAKNKIHPTYIQKILTDKRYNKLDYLKIINSLKKTESKKYNPIKYFQFSFFSQKAIKKSYRSVYPLKNKKILIIGAGESVKKNRHKIEKFINKNKIFVIALNTIKEINPELINLRVACHPQRIISDISFYKNREKKLIIPYSSLNKNIKSLIKSYKINFYDYGLNLSTNKEIIISKNFCTLPYPLAIGYALSIVKASFCKSVYFAGIDGFNINDPASDNTKELLELFKKRVFKKKLLSITRSGYKKIFKIIKL